MLEGQENVLLLVADDDLFKLDNVWVRELHLAKLTENGHLPERCHWKPVRFLSHLYLLKRVQLSRLLVFR